MAKDIEQFLLNTICSDALKDTVERVGGFHRVKGMDGLRASIEVLRDCLEKLPGTSVTIRDYPGDGKTRYGTWPAPAQWRIDGCHAEVLFGNGEKRVIADMTCANFGVYSYSGRVMPEKRFRLITEKQALGISGAEAGEPGGGILDPSETVVFFRDFSVPEAASLLLERSYRGVITAPLSEKYRDDAIMMHARHWHRIPQTGREDFSRPDRLPFGFSITPAQGDALESMLERNGSGADTASPVLSVALDTAFTPGMMPVLEVVVDGGIPRDAYVVVTSHICHPGPSANDNASGVATAAALAGTMARILTGDAAARFDTGVVFLFVPENLGTMAWLLDPPIPLSRIRAGLNFDMTGADPDLSGARLYTVAPPFIHDSPLAGQTFRNLQRAAELLREFPGEIPSTIPMAEFGFHIGSDNHILNFPDFGIPSVGFGCWPDRFYHTDADTPERINPATMKHVALAGALTLVEILESPGIQRSGSLHPPESETADSSSNGMPPSMESAPRRLYRGPVYRGIVFDRSNGRELSVLDRLSSAHRFRDITALALAEMLIDGRRTVPEILRMLADQGIDLPEDIFRELLTQLARYELIRF